MATFSMCKKLLYGQIAVVSPFLGYRQTQRHKTNPKYIYVPVFDTKPPKKQNTQSRNRLNPFHAIGLFLYPLTA